MKQLRMVIPLAGLLVLIFFSRLAFTDHILARGDTYAYFYPYWAVRDAHLRAGEMPLWTPDVFMGAPLLANSQLGTYYPPNWLTIYQSPPDAIRISILIHVFWAIIGAMVLARHTFGLSALPALVAGVVFGLGGYIGSHVEQINQLQGLSWMPWLFLFTHLATQKRRYWVLLGIAWALQLLSGHTQTVFITGVGLGIMVLFTPPPTPSPQGGEGAKTGDNLTSPPFSMQGGKGAGGIGVFLKQKFGFMLGLITAVLIAIILALPQIIPTQGLISQSNRGGGLNPQQATAFSLDPFMLGRGLLPSYDGQPFGEYVAYIGIIGFAFAIIGMFASDRRKWAWLGLGGIGFLLALGRFNPAYYSILAELPGFNLFRVPARWLALFALACAMLIGLGVQTVMTNPLIGRRRNMALGTFIILCVALMIGSQFADRTTEPVIGSALPTTITWVGWGVALLTSIIMFVGTAFFPSVPIISKGARLFALFLILELFFAGLRLPHQDLTDPNAYHETRFAINQLRAYQTSIPADRFLSISAVYFDPGDKASLQARWGNMGLSEQAQAYAFTATKLKEVVASNLPLIWGIPTIDGFDGGVLPTANYTAFTSLLLPEGALRTVDGRLRENLALPQCGGACIPPDRWLDLTNTRYLLTDKVYDVVQDGVFFDTQFSYPTGIIWNAPYEFSADAVQVLFQCDGECDAPQIRVNDGESVMSPAQIITPTQTDLYQLAIYPLETVTNISSITPQGDTIISAITVVDTRTGDFLQIHPDGWKRVYSADIKIYENLDVMPRAFMVYDVLAFPDTWDGTEQALSAMHDENFDPRTTITLNHDGALPRLDGVGAGNVTITRYTDTQIEMTIETDKAGYVVLTDAYYAGWSAQVNGSDMPIYRADVMFRAVYVSMGMHTVLFEYRGW
ncbi:MAG: YfhO family protein [Anaerolineae bacterium]|nr:YfhO family protein [Anaerolineae bacterium]